MNKKIAIALIVAIVLVGAVLFFALGGFRQIQRMLMGPRGNFGEFGDSNAFGPRGDFGEFGDSNAFFVRIGESLGLPEGATKEQVLEALGLPEEASQQQIMEALHQKGIMPMRRN